MLGVSADDFKEMYFKHNHLSNIHNLPLEEMVLKVVAEFDASKEAREKTKAWLRASVAQNKFNTELVDLFPLFRKQGLKIGILSNATSAMRQKLEAYHIPELVDEIVISGEIGFQKPHKEAFEIVFDQLGVHAHEAIFVDDSLKSLEKASEIGYIPILFKDNNQLKADLKRLSISVE
jgi:HAD superfamily hydrolase (TIGR01549 family)